MLRPSDTPRQASEHSGSIIFSQYEPDVGTGHTRSVNPLFLMRGIQGDVWKARIDITEFRQLYVNVVRAANCRLGIVAGPEHRVISVVGWTGQVANEF